MFTFQMFVLLWVVTGAGAAMYAWRRLPATSRLRRAAAAVEDTGARFYPKSSTTIARLQRRCLQRMVNSVTVGVTGTVLVPSDYSIVLSVPDFELVEPVRIWFVSELADAIRARAGADNWRCDGRVHVTLAVSYDQPIGVPAVTAVFGAATQLDEPAARTLIAGPTELIPDDRTPRAFLLVAGKSRPLVDGSVIGRSTSADLQVDFPSVSRRHCRFTNVAGTWMVEDLGSLNGTKINGAPLSGSTGIFDGDEITFAPGCTARLTYPAPAGAPTGTAGDAPARTHAS